MSEVQFGARISSTPTAASAGARRLCKSRSFVLGPLVFSSGVTEVRPREGPVKGVPIRVEFWGVR